MVQNARRIRAGVAVVVTCCAALAPVSLAAPAPGKDSCKNGGWQSQGFKNQGQCVSAYNHGFEGGSGSI
jgi:hypothetical protein